MSTAIHWIPDPEYVFVDNLCINDLPNELVELIMDNMDSITLVKFSTTCSRFRGFLSQYVHRYQISYSKINNIMNMVNYSGMMFDNIKLDFTTDNFKKKFSKIFLPSITTKLHMVGFRGHLPALTKYLPNLKSLHLTHCCRIKSNDYPVGLKNLTIKSTIIKQLPINLEKLTIISIVPANLVYPQGLSHLTIQNASVITFPKTLNHLALVNCDRIEDALPVGLQTLRFIRCNHYNRINSVYRFDLTFEDSITYWPPTLHTVHLVNTLWKLDIETIHPIDQHNIISDTKLHIPSTVKQIIISGNKYIDYYKSISDKRVKIQYASTN